MSVFDKLIPCAFDGCEEAFGDHNQFVSHLKYGHKIKLDEYIRRFPSARTEPIVPEIEVEDQPVAPTPEPEIAAPQRAFDPSTITDPDYLRAALEHLPGKKEFFETVVQEFLDTGLPDIKLVEQCGLMSVMIRDLQLEILSRTSETGGVFAHKDEIDSMKAISETLKKTLDSIKAVFEQTREENQIHNMVEKIVGEADTHIRQNLGEQCFRCECGLMIDTSGFSHWAFEILKDVRGKKLYLLWSDHLWEMVKGFTVVDRYGEKHHHKMEIWQMAYSLQTSIEGLMFTARHRNMDVDRFEEGGRKMASIDGHKIDLGEQEEQSRLAMEHYERVYHPKSLRDIGK